jgi:hypothetical protein
MSKGIMHIPVTYFLDELLNKPVLNWPPGSGSLLFVRDLKEFQKKVKHFIIFDDLLPV